MHPMMCGLLPKAMKRHLHAFLADEAATTSIEYALIAALVAITILPATSGLGGKLSATFGTISNALDDAPTAAPAPPFLRGG